jgi:hypothetical protein
VVYILYRYTRFLRVDPIFFLAQLVFTGIPVATWTEVVHYNNIVKKNRREKSVCFGVEGVIDPT